MVGFCDLVGTGIAPVSKKAAVKADLSSRVLSHSQHSELAKVI